MKVHKIELVIVDHDGLGAEEIKLVLENARYPNHCIMPSVIASKTVDIGEWEDNNPLNFTDKIVDEAKRLFGE